MKWLNGKFEFRGNKLHAKFGKDEKDCFDYDVSGLGVYVDEQSTEVMQNLINEGNLKSRMNIMTGVKGSEIIKLINSSPSLQAAASCGWTATGGMILTDATIATVRVKIQEEYCNEDLNDTWAQIMNIAGANDQDTEPPTFADAMLAYYQMKAQELDENLIMNGDTDSGDSDLAHYDGFAKLWTNDAEVIVAGTSATSITATNGFDILKEFYDYIPIIVKRHKNTIGAEILCGFETARKCIDQIYTDKDYASSIEVTEENGEISFTLPTTNMTVRSIPQLDGTESVFGVCYKYMFYGTDLENDQDGFTWKYSDYDEKLRFGVKWRCGIQYVFPEYFTRLRLTTAS